jgi:hypothetical protein
MIELLCCLSRNQWRCSDFAYLNAIGLSDDDDNGESGLSA